MASLIRCILVVLCCVVYAFAMPRMPALSLDSRSQRAERPPLEGLYDNTFYRGYGSSDAQLYSRFGGSQPESW